MSDIVKKCASCGKTIAPSAHGALASWFFRQVECNCEAGSVSAQRSAPQPIRTVSPGSSSAGGIASDHGSHHAKDQLQDPLCGTIWDERYQIFERLGMGAWGAVYKAKDSLLNRMVALKLLHPGMRIDPNSLERFRREAMAASALQHPSVVVVFDWKISPHGQPYIVMELLEGQPLSEILSKNGARRAGEAIKIFLALADALAAAHSQGIVHRDLKPSNIMIVKKPNGELIPKIVDFGLAKVLNLQGPDAKSLTAAGELVGTIYYISPEQCRAMPIDHRSDIYSFGCIMYETVSGQKAFEAPDVFTCIYRHFNENPLPFAEIAPHIPVPDGLEAVIFRALDKDPARRFQSMEQLHDALSSIADARTYPAVKRSHGNIPTRSPSLDYPGQDTLLPPAAKKFPTVSDKAMTDMLKKDNKLGVVTASTLSRTAVTKDPFRFALAATTTTFLLLAGSGAWFVCGGPGTDKVIAFVDNGSYRQGARLYTAFAACASVLGNQLLARKNALAAKRWLLDFANQAQPSSQAQLAVSDMLVLAELGLAGDDKISAFDELGNKLLLRGEIAAAERCYTMTAQLTDRPNLTVANCRTMVEEGRRLMHHPETEHVSHAAERLLLHALSLSSVIAFGDRQVGQEMADECLKSLADYYHEQGRTEDAIAFRQRLCVSYLARGERADAAVEMAKIGDFYKELGKSKQANQRYKDAEKLAAEAQDLPSARLNHLSHPLSASAESSGNHSAKAEFAENHVGNSEHSSHRANKIVANHPKQTQVLRNQPQANVGWRDHNSNSARPNDLSAGEETSTGSGSSRDSVVNGGRTGDGSSESRVSGSGESSKDVATANELWARNNPATAQWLHDHPRWQQYYKDHPEAALKAWKNNHPGVAQYYEQHPEAAGAQYVKVNRQVKEALPATRSPQ